MKINPALSDWLGLELGEALEIRLSQISKSLAPEQLLMFLDSSIKVLGELKSSFIIQLPLELMIARICTAPAQPVLTPPTLAVTDGGQPKAAIPPRASQSESLKTNAVNSENIDYELILSKWGEFLARIKTSNLSLSFILKVCQPKSLNGNELCLAFKYKFHKDRIMDPTIKMLLEKILHETYSTSLTIEAVIDEQLEVTVGNTMTEAELPSEVQPIEPSVKGENEKMVDNLLKAFGGKIVG